MKKFKAIALVLVLALGLAACGPSGDKTEKETKGESAASQDEKTTTGDEVLEGNIYTYVYSGPDPASFDYTVTFRSIDHDHLTNFIDGLYETDANGKYVPSMAERSEVSEDGKTYTYYLRPGVQWVTNTGEEYAEVTAHDFVTGLKHAVDSESQQLEIVKDSIEGLADYADGITTDFDEVGVKALDDYTVEYTLTAPEPFWYSKTTFGILFPINEDFLNSKGDDYGKPTADSILYNGPFILSNFTPQSEISYIKNDKYWDKDNVNIDGIKLIWAKGDHPEDMYYQFDKGVYTAATLYPTKPFFAEAAEKYGDNIVITPPKASTFNMTFNLNRASHKHTNKDESQQEDTHKAIMNNDFRKAINFAIDREAYLAQRVGKEGAKNVIRNLLTTPNLVQIDGKPYYDQVLEEMIKIDEEAFGDVNLGDSQDGWFNPEKAKTYLEKAKTALEADGVKFPIHLDLPQDGANEILINQSKSLKQSIEETLGTENVVVDIQLLDKNEYASIAYAADFGSAVDFDLSTASGWGPDYVDPSSFLDIYNPYKGAMVISLGLDADGNYEGEDPGKAVKEELKLDEYAKLLDAANAIREDLPARYKAYAKAEAWLLNANIQIPLMHSGAGFALTRVVPFTTAYAPTGAAATNSGSRYKYMELQDEPVTTEQYNAARAAWEKAVLEGLEANENVSEVK